MVPDNVMQLVDRLIAETESGRLRWVPFSASRFSDNEATLFAEDYVTAFSNYSVNIFRDTASRDIKLSLLDSSGLAIGSYVVKDAASESKFVRLLAEASRQRIDEAINTILRDLAPA